MGCEKNSGREYVGCEGEALSDIQPYRAEVMTTLTLFQLKEGE